MMTKICHKNEWERGEGCVSGDKSMVTREKENKRNIYFERGRPYGVEMLVSTILSCFCTLILLSCLFSFLF